MNRNKLLWTGLLPAFFSAFAAAQTNFDAVAINTHKASEGIHLLEGEGGNIGFSVGDNTKIIPGHGSLSLKKDLRANRDMPAKISANIGRLISSSRLCTCVQEHESRKSCGESALGGHLRTVRAPHSDIRLDRYPQM